MSFPPSRPLPRHRPLSANEIAAVAVAAESACPAPRDAPGAIERVRRIGGAWRRGRVAAVKNGAQPS